MDSTEWTTEVGGAVGEGTTPSHSNRPCLEVELQDWSLFRELEAQPNNPVPRDTSVCVLGTERSTTKAHMSLLSCSGQVTLKSTPSLMQVTSVSLVSLF